MSEASLRKILYKTLEDNATYTSGQAIQNLRIVQFDGSGEFAAEIYFQIGVAGGGITATEKFEFLASLNSEGKYSISQIFFPNSQNPEFDIASFENGVYLRINLDGAYFTDISARKEIKYGSISSASTVIVSSLNPLPTFTGAAWIRIDPSKSTQLENLVVDSNTELGNATNLNNTTDVYGKLIVSTSSGNIIEAKGEVAGGNLTNRLVLDVDGNTTINGSLDVDDIQIDDNSISTTSLDKKINLGNAADVQILIAGSLDVDGTTDLDNTNIVGNAILTDGALTVDSIKIDGNTVSSTDGNIILDPNGSGTIDLEKITNVKELLNADGGIEVGEELFTVSEEDGDTYIDGTLEVEGQSTFNSNVNADGGLDVNEEFDVDTEGNLVTSGTVNITNDTPSSSFESGALIVAGGVGVGEDLFVSNKVEANRIETRNASNFAESKFRLLNYELLLHFYVYQDGDWTKQTSYVDVEPNDPREDDLLYNTETESLTRFNIPVSLGYGNKYFYNGYVYEYIEDEEIGDYWRKDIFQIFSSIPSPLPDDEYIVDSGSGSSVLLYSEGTNTNPETILKALWEPATISGRILDEEANMEFYNSETALGNGKIYEKATQLLDVPALVIKDELVIKNRMITDRIEINGINSIPFIIKDPNFNNVFFVRNSGQVFSYSTNPNAIQSENYNLQTWSQIVSEDPEDGIETRIRFINNGNIETIGDIAVNGGDITTTSATFNIGNTATGAGQTVNLGAAALTTGTKEINLGTGGATGSTTNINVGSSIAGKSIIHSPATEINGSFLAKGNTDIGQSATRVSLNEYLTTFNQLSTGNSTINSEGKVTLNGVTGIDALSAAAILIDSGTSTTIDATTFVSSLSGTTTSIESGTTMTIESGTTMTLDATTALSIKSKDTTDITMTATNASGTKTLVVESTSSGAGAANLDLKAKSQVNVQSLDINIGNTSSNTIDLATKTTTGGQVSVTSPNLDINSTTVSFDGVTTEGSTVTITGALNVDNIKIDGTEISSTQNTITINPKSAESNTGTVIIAGNLTVNGTTTTINSTTKTIDDPLLTLGGDTNLTSLDAFDRGVEFRYFNTESRLGFFGFDNSTNRFTFVPQAENNSEVISGDTGVARFSNLELGNLTGNVGTLSTATLNGNRTYTLPNLTGTLATLDNSQVFREQTFVSDGSSTKDGITISSSGAGSDSRRIFLKTPEGALTDTFTLRLQAKDDTIAVLGDIKDTTITIEAGTDLATGGTFTLNQSSDATITLNHDNVTRTDTTSTGAPENGGTFTAVDTITTSSTGHITAVNLKTVTLPLYNIFSDTTSTTNTFKLGVASTVGSQTINNQFNVIGRGGTSIRRLSSDEIPQENPAELNIDNDLVIQSIVPGAGTITISTLGSGIALTSLISVDEAPPEFLPVTSEVFSADQANNSSKQIKIVSNATAASINGTIVLRNNTGGFEAGKLNVTEIDSTGQVRGSLFKGVDFITDSSSTESFQQLLRGNDYFKIIGNNPSTSGPSQLIIETGNDGTQPIIFRQVGGSPSPRDLTLMDESGNTSMPGNLAIGSGTGTYWDIESGDNLVFKSSGITAITVNKRTTSGGEVILNSTSNNSGIAYSNGALQVAGGAGFNGSVYINQNLYFPSDERLKVKTGIVGEVLDKVLATDIWKFTYTERISEEQIGIMAQDIERNMPELAPLLIEKGDDPISGLKDKRTLKETKLIYVLWQAFKEETQKRKSLEERLIAIEQKINRLEK